MSPVADPYLSDTPQLLTRTLTKTAAATVVTAAGDTITLDLLTGSTTSWDETRAPRVIATLVCRVPDDVAALGRIDPRAGCRVKVEAGYLRPGGTLDQQLIADLALRSRPVRRPDNIMTLTAMSDESLFIDNSPTVGGAFTRTDTILAIQAVAPLALPGISIDTTAMGSAGPAVTQDTYSDRWTICNDYADQLGAQLYDNGLRQWKLAPVPVLGTVMHSMAVGEGGTILESEAGLDRDDFANQVMVVYRWRDTSDVDHTTTATRRVTSGVYAATSSNTKTLLVERDNATTQAQANAAAAAIVARTVTRGRSLVVVGEAAYWLRPGMTVDVTLPVGDTERHLVAAVEFDHADGTMRVTTRLPDNTGTIGA